MKLPDALILFVVAALGVAFLYAGCQSDRRRTERDKRWFDACIADGGKEYECRQPLWPR